jgi:hypothetical protein
LLNAAEHIDPPTPFLWDEGLIRQFAILLTTWPMKVVGCPTLGLLIQNHELVELIDIRPRTEFSAMHIPEARSLPFADLIGRRPGSQT